jgi:transmembrane sensor
MNEANETLEELNPLQRDALARVRHLGSGRASARDIAEARMWGDQSAAHHEALAWASRFWDRLGEAGHDFLNRRETVQEQRIAVSASRFSRRALLGGAVAASAAAYLTVRPPLELWPSASEVLADYRTAPGEQRKIVVDSGVHVVLNTQTSLNARAVADGGGIELVAGEAAIATGADLDNALRVTVGDGRVTARQARFNIRHDRFLTCVTCLEGNLSVERRSAEAKLKAGQQVVYVGQGLTAVTTIDPAQVSAWQQGVLVFQYAPLRDVVTEVNRYRPGKIMLMNAELGQRLVNGRFRTDNIDSVLTVFQQIFSARLTRLPGGIVLLS